MKKKSKKKKTVSKKRKLSSRSKKVIGLGVMAGVAAGTAYAVYKKRHKEAA